MLAHRTLSILPFAALAYSGPLTGRNPQCVTGQASCCQQVQSANSPLATALNLAGLLDGILLGGNSQIGLQCSSLTGAGSSAKCESRTVCCNDTSMNGFVNLGCSPLDIDL